MTRSGSLHGGGSWALWGPEEVEVSGLWALEPGSGLSLRAPGDL